MFFSLVFHTILIVKKIPFSDSIISETDCCDWWTKRSKRLAALEFDRVRKSMSVMIHRPTGSNHLLVKVLDHYDLRLLHLD